MRGMFFAEIPVFRFGYAWASEYECIRYDQENIPETVGLPKNLRAQVAKGIYPDSHFRKYDPFREPALFQIYADLGNPDWRPEEDIISDPASGELCQKDPAPPGFHQKIIDFSNRYGLLTEGPNDAHASFHNASMLADAIQLWRSVENRDDKTPSLYVTRNGLRPTLIEKWLWDWDHGMTVSREVLKDRQPPYRNLASIAQRLLDLTITSGVRSTNFELRMQRRKPDGPLIPHIEAKTLLDVLWVQFALAVAENREYRRCDFCSRPYELSPSVSRADKVFCSDTCRVKAYYRRQAKARKMREEGQHLRAIVKAVGSDTKTVKRWVGEA